jgi:phosphocarrier protein
MTSFSASGVYQCLADVKIVNRRGLHIRATAAFVKCAEKFDAEVTVTKDGLSANGTSIMSLLMLAAGQGSQITIETEGPDAEEVLEALTTLIEQGFNEPE